MTEFNAYEKQPPTAPSSVYMYPTGAPQPPQYGFQTPSDPNFGYPAPPSQQPPPYTQQAYPNYISQQPSYNPTPPAPATTQQTVVIIGGCPSCRVGTLEEDYTCCGILCAICFFPLGILCCLAMKEKKCTNCGATF